MTLYSDITNNLVSYSNILSNFSTYSQLNSYVPYMSGAGYGEYELQVFKYQPVAYWSVTTSENAAIEPSVFGSNAELEKIAGTDGYKSIVHSTDPGTNILFEEDYLLVPVVEFNKIKIAKSNYQNQPFTINFWYKNMNNVIDTETSIFKVGDLGDYRIDLHTKNGKFVLDFLGQISYVEVSDYREIYNISIVFDGINSKLFINGQQGITLNQITNTFDASPFAMWQSGIGCQTIFSHISIYGYPFSIGQANKLYLIGSNNSEALNNMYDRVSSIKFTNSISEYYSTNNYSLDSNSILRNCLLIDNVLKLQPKKIAQINGAVYSSGRYSFASTANISFDLLDTDVDRNNASFRVTSSNLISSSGTPLYINCLNPISVSLDSGEISVSLASIDTPIFSDTVISGTTYFAVEFIDGKIWINLGGTKTETDYYVPTSFTSVVIGNSNNGLDPYSGYISDFTLNYANQPLQIGIYKLDLNVSHTNYIKPKQDGVALLSIYAESGTKINYLSYKSSGAAQVQKFTSSNSVEEYYSCQNGTDIKDGDALSESEISSDTSHLLSARLYDNISSDNYYDTELPKITDLKYVGYSSIQVNAINSPSYISSLADNPYREESVYPNEFLFKTNNEINISGNGSPDFRSIMFYLKVKSISNSGTTNHIEIDSNSNLAIVKINNNTYKLKLVVPSGYEAGYKLFVNGSQYAANVNSNNVYINDDVYVTVVCPSSSNINIAMSNMNNKVLSNLALSSQDVSSYAPEMADIKFSNTTKVITDSSTLSLTDDILVKAFTSNIVFSG